MSRILNIILVWTIKLLLKLKFACHKLFYLLIELLFSKALVLVLYWKHSCRFKLEYRDECLGYAKKIFHKTLVAKVYRRFAHYCGKLGVPLRHGHFLWCPILFHNVCYYSSGISPILWEGMRNVKSLSCLVSNSSPLILYQHNCFEVGSYKQNGVHSIINKLRIISLSFCNRAGIHYSGERWGVIER